MTRNGPPCRNRSRWYPNCFGRGTPAFRALLIAPARRRTCSRVRLSLAADAGRVEAIGSLRQKLIDVLLQNGLQQMGLDAEFGGNHARDKGKKAARCLPSILCLRV